MNIKVTFHFDLPLETVDPVRRMTVANERINALFRAAFKKGGEYGPLQFLSDEGSLSSHSVVILEDEMKRHIQARLSILDAERESLRKQLDDF